MDKEDKLLKVDEILGSLEDFLHGKSGEKVTEARKELGDLIEDPPVSNIDGDTLVEIKGVVVDTIKERKDKINEDIKEYGEASGLLDKQMKVDVQKLSNLQTEICINLDKKFGENGA